MLAGCFLCGVMVWCSPKTENNNTENAPQELEKPLVENDTQTDTKGDTWSLDEYQLHFQLNSSDPSGLEFVVEMDVYRKQNNIRYIIHKMPQLPDVPFAIEELMVKDGKYYSKISADGEAFWTMTNEGAGMMDAFFDLETAQESLSEASYQTQDELIDGMMMTCYYKKDESESGKACTHQGIFAYAESEMLDGSDIKTVMKVSEFQRSVSDGVFGME